MQGNDAMLDNNNHQGKLNLSRYPGQAILLYPSQSAMESTVAELFAEPMLIQFTSVTKNNEVYSRISADRRLVIVRQEIYNRNTFHYNPSPAMNEEAYRKAFVQLASEMLDEEQFEAISRRSWSKVG